MRGVYKLPTESERLEKITRSAGQCILRRSSFGLVLRILEHSSLRFYSYSVSNGVLPFTAALKRLRFSGWQLRDCFLSSISEECGSRIGYCLFRISADCGPTSARR